jgi:hypothetical protein
MPKSKTNIYRLTITLINRVKPGSVRRVIEIPSDATLLVLHTMIFRAFDRKKERLWSFYIGRPGGVTTAEYALHADDMLESGPHCDALSAKGVKLKSLSLADEPELYYLFDYSDEWWHRVEFLEEIPTKAGVDYPRVAESVGASPPQIKDGKDSGVDILYLELPTNSAGLHEGERLTITLQDEITFTEIEDALVLQKGARSAASTIGLVCGCIAAPHPVSPSKYLPSILGARSVRVSTAERITSLVLSLHNRIAKAVRESDRLSLRRAVVSDVRQGVAQLSKDLAEELDGFKEGLLWGTERKSEWPESLNKPLGTFWAYGMQVDMARRIRWQRNRSLTDEVAAREYTRLQELAPQIEAAMLEVTRILRGNSDQE